MTKPQLRVADMSPAELRNTISWGVFVGLLAFTLLPGLIAYLLWSVALGLSQ